MISFIVPTKNEEKTIEKTLKCISEYRGEKEIIVSDGRSTDGTIPLAKKYATVIEPKNNAKQNISIGKNGGAKKARGEYLVFLDADVCVPDINSFFQKAESILLSNPKIVGLTVAIRVFPENENLGDKIIFPVFNFYNLILNNYLGIGAAVGEFQMVRRDVFEKLGGYDERLVASEDYEFFQRLAKEGKTYFAKGLKIYHTGRRGHQIGWPKLLSQWVLNGFSVAFRKRAYTKEWKVIR